MVVSKHYLHLDKHFSRDHTFGMDTREQLIADIDIFLARTKMPETTLGRIVVNDTSLVSRLRNGRSPRLETYDKVRRFIDEYVA